MGGRDVERREGFWEEGQVEVPECVQEFELEVGERVCQQKYQHLDHLHSFKSHQGCVSAFDEEEGEQSQEEPSDYFHSVLYFIGKSGHFLVDSGCGRNVGFNSHSCQVISILVHDGARREGKGKGVLVERPQVIKFDQVGRTVIHFSGELIAFDCHSIVGNSNFRGKLSESETDWTVEYHIGLQLVVGSEGVDCVAERR